MPTNPGLRGCFIVPYRVRFATEGVLRSARAALPVLWHSWSELTDIRRISFERRWRILWDWWLNRPPTLPVPFEARAVKWWMSRLLRGPAWDWDDALIADLSGTEVNGAAAGVHGPGSLRPPLREFLAPQALAEFRTSELGEPEDDHWYVPPVSCYHLRLQTLPGGCDGRLLVPRSGISCAVVWRAIRLHQFRFGDGFLSFEFEASEEPQALYPKLKEWCVADHIAVSFAAEPPADEDGDRPPPPHHPIPWATDRELPLRKAVEALLTPGKVYDPGAPDTEQWFLAWEDSRAARAHPHRIEFPLPDELSCVVAEELPAGAAEPAETTPTAAVSVSGPLATLALPADENGKGRRSASRPINVLSVFLLAVFRRLKLVEVADLLATPSGPDPLSSAQFLQYVSYQLSLARDRFLGDSPVFGGTPLQLWKNLQREWRLVEQEERLVPAIEDHRYNYFRGRSLRLIARVTSTFWFLFRWVLLPIMLVKFVVVIGAAMAIGLAAMLTLSLFATIAVFIARRLYGRLSREEAPPEAPAEAAAKRRRRIDWVAVAAAVEAVLLVALVVLRPDLKKLILAVLGSFAGALVIVVAAATVIFRHRWRRETLARFFLRETVPIVALVLAGLCVLALLVTLGVLISRLGPEAFTLIPKFWGDDVPGSDG